MIVSLELGLIYAVMALGVYLTFKILNFPDLTVDGSFTTGAATAAMMIAAGQNPLLAMAVAFIVGCLAGLITGLLHAKGNINPLLAGILTMLALYSINLRIMGNRANVPLLGEETVFTWLADVGLRGSWASVIIMLIFVVLVKFALDWFLSTDMGLALQATGDNEEMVRSYGVSTDRMKIIGLMLSNGLVALCGAIIAQNQGSADISMGIGLILIGLASVIVGQAIFGTRTVVIATFGVIVGSVLYRVAIQLALNAGLNPNDMKLISAILVVIALLLPQWKLLQKLSLRRKRKDVQEMNAEAADEAAEEAHDDGAAKTTTDDAKAGHHA